MTRVSVRFVRFVFFVRGCFVLELRSCVVCCSVAGCVCVCVPVICCAVCGFVETTLLFCVFNVVLCVFVRVCVLLCVSV